MTEKIMVRQATTDDLDAVMRVEEEAWPAEMRAPREKFESRLRTFPQGFYVTIIDGKIMGVSTSMRFQYHSDHPPRTWDEVTANGWMTNHDPQGNALYVVSVGVSPQAHGKGVGSQLVQAQKELVRKLKLDSLVLGARCPEYHSPEFDQVPVKQYVQMTRSDQQPQDKELRFYVRNGLKVVCAMPEYMGTGNDPESRDYGIIMAWDNPENKQR